MLKPGDKAPLFCLPDKDGNEVCLKNLISAKKWVVLYFYPKDLTSGCTLEAVDFTEALGAFEKLGAVVLGVSADSEEMHCRFAEKNALKVTLLSDPGRKAIEPYGVWQKKKMAGKEYMGIVRTTFLIDPSGKIAHVWEKVKAAGHVEEVKKKLTELKK